MMHCRFCDLTFCERHLDAHDDALGHPPLVENEAATFCSVCVGIYRPTTASPETDD